MKTLVLITSHFPFGTGETFLETEFPFLIRNFDKVIIIAQNTSDQKTRQLPVDVSIFRYNPATSLAGYLYMPVLFIIDSGEIIKMLWEEIDFRLSSGNKLTFRKFLYLFKKIIKAEQLKAFINRKLTAEKVTGSVVFYSYWLKSGAHAIALLNFPDSIRVSRAHGSDLYEEKTRDGYLPLLKFSALRLDQIFFISNQGKKYLEEKLNISDSRFDVSYLGVNRPDIPYVKPERSDKFIIVSCSNMIHLKRINLIIGSLEKIGSEKKIFWMHFGDGPLKSELEAHANKQLGSLKGITWKFMGRIPNKELLEFYASHKVDLFINTSLTEGVPVSIMEAQSFGIPVIATDTGGVAEIVRDGTGSLLPVEFHETDLTKLIEHYINLPEDETEKIRFNAFSNWKINFNASDNYEDFINKLNSIFASGKVSFKKEV